MLFGSLFIAASLVASSSARVSGARRQAPDTANVPATVDDLPNASGVPLAHVPLHPVVAPVLGGRGLDALSVLATVPLLASQSLVKVKAQPTIVVPSKAVGSLLKPVVDLLTSAVPGGITLLPAVNTLVNSLVKPVTSLAPILEPVGTIVSVLLPTAMASSGGSGGSGGDAAKPQASGDSPSSGSPTSSSGDDNQATAAPEATPAPAGRDSPAPKAPSTLVNLSLVVLNPLA